ncbi:MAG: hypothetical protein L0Y50_07120 [Beijerinckiaceae bacterium]|nr:hypothetical protein [Beijerinckiaceae bacterium]
MSAPDRREMIDRAGKALSIRRQRALAGVSRSGVYRPERPANGNGPGDHASVLASMVQWGRCLTSCPASANWLGVGGLTRQ